MAEADDGTLAAQAKAGDREAFGTLVHRHSGAMLAVARAYFASEADAEDGVQAWRHLDQLASDDRFAAWLTRITRNTCLNILAARTDKVSLEAFAGTAQLRPALGRIQFAPATLARKGEEAEMLLAAVGRLPEDQRVVILLRYVEGLTYEQMALYLDVPASTVRGRLQGAKHALEQMLTCLDFAEG